MIAKNLKDWSKKVMARDYYRCRACGNNGCRLGAHHIESRVKVPQLSLDTDNGISLCPKCHGEADSILPFRQFRPEALKQQIYRLPKSEVERLKNEKATEGSTSVA